RELDFSAFLLMLYAFFWQGWVLIFFVIFSSAIIIILYNHFILKDKSGSKNSFSYFGIFSVLSFFAVTLAFGTGEFFVLFREGWIALKNFLTPQLSLWPDLYISVSELHNATLSYIVEYSGGKFFIVIALLGFIASLITIPRQKNIQDIPKIIIITVFLSISLIISSGAQRFVMLVFVPLSIFFAIGIERIYRFFSFVINSRKAECPSSTAIDPKKLILNILLTVVILATVLIPINSINNTIESLLNPIFNETWESSLLQIKEKTPKDSIITTWWPPGHFIKSIAERSVTFDGATINVPQAYWVSNIFLSQNETQALGFIRMLNNSGNKAADFLVKERGFELSTSIALLKLITGLPPIKAAIALSTVFNEADSINRLLELTHKTPPPSYLLIYNEFVENNLQLKFIGKWNFAELEKINKDPALLKQVPDRNSDKYVQFLWKLVGGAYKYSGILDQLDANRNRVIFEENVTIDLKTKECNINSNTYGKGTPISVIYLEDNEVKEELQKTPSLSYSVLLIKDQEAYKCILLDRPLAKSLLVHLYFFEGKGLKYFKPLIKESDLTVRTKILVYEVDWKRYSAETQINLPKLH
ncbi:MAG: dolichyl-diphosphooligosaccharide--protein glycosyltransferase subunit STT3, partial [Candidatus Omnitrophica bacterium]|nr:dolichyl-diphosphooligosaccharide--protein glycosyltransferase subunit STT3 [Candidatus Omnitrophota bacterium]